MSITQANAVCPAILVGIEEILTKNKLADLMTPVGLTQALLDPTNRNPETVVQNVDAGAGHPKSVRIKRKQPAAAGESSTSKNCTTGSETPWLEDNFTVNQYRQKTIHVTEATVRTLCDSSSALVPVPGGSFRDNKANAGPLSVISQIVEDLLLQLDGLRLDINNDLLTSWALAYGAYQGGGTSKNFSMYRSTDTAAGFLGAPILDGFVQMRREISRTTLNGEPIIFGEGILDLAVQSLNYGCCNIAGNDFGKMAGSPGFKYYKDFQAGTALGNANAFGAFLPGMAQFASYNEYVGGFTTIGVMERGLMPDPKLPGIMYDIRFLPNECGEYYDLFVGLHFDLYTAPTNLFKTGDRRTGINGNFKGIAVGL